MSVHVYVSCVLKEANSKYRGEIRFFFRIVIIIKER